MADENKNLFIIERCLRGNVQMVNASCRNLFYGCPNDNEHNTTFGKNLEFLASHDLEFL